jgi:hypothetical protein
VFPSHFKLLIEEKTKIIPVHLYQILKMKRSLFCFLLALPYLCYAQSNFQKGSLITNSGDTLKGLINYREREYSPKAVSFKANKDADTKNFSIKDISGFGVDNHVAYQRHFVNVSMSKISLNALTFGMDTSRRRDTVLLQVLRSGKHVNLYKFVDKIKTRYYVKESEAAEPLELIKQQYIKSMDSNVMVTKNYYVGQLLVLLRKYNVGEQYNEDRLASISYTADEIGKVISLINNKQEVKSNLKYVRYFAGTGVNYSRTRYTGENTLASSDAKIKGSIFPMLTGGLDVFANPAIGKIIYRFELSVMKNKAEVSAASLNDFAASYKHTFDDFTIRFTPQVIYNIYNKPAFRFFIGGGAGLNFVNYSNNLFTSINAITNAETVVEDYLTFPKFNFSLHFSTGVVINKHVQLIALYSPASQISDYSYFALKTQRASIGLNYLFGNH